MKYQRAVMQKYSSPYLHEGAHYSIRQEEFIVSKCHCRNDCVVRTFTTLKNLVCESDLLEVLPSGSPASNSDALPSGQTLNLCFEE